MAKFVYVGHPSDDPGPKEVSFDLGNGEKLFLRRGEPTEIDAAKSAAHAHLAKKLKANSHFRQA